MPALTLSFIGLFLLVAGFIIGLGAVTVIDLHGFLGRKSTYWTEATTRTHKVTKPLIWIGILLALIGGVIFYRNEGLSITVIFHLVSSIILIFEWNLSLFFSQSVFVEKGTRGSCSRSSFRRFGRKRLRYRSSFHLSFGGAMSQSLYGIVYT